MRTVLLGLAVALAATAASAQENAQENVDPMSAATFKGMALRNIGPAFMSGRISDIDLHPQNPHVWYVSVGSGGVWKTTNAGTTWTPLFDEQPTYSIGSLTVDARNPHVVWVGTGEDVGGRHVGYGDGIYRSMDGGKSWENKGLKDSEHITQIIVHPEDSNTVWVAAQGPLWSSGGQRGIYKTTDGGDNWIQTLGDDEWTGAASLVIDPRNPDVLYAATWQHHRTVAAWMGGGPKSGIHKSVDGGDTWTELESGLPEGNMGKIGLAISPHNPDTVYAAIELDRREGAIYRTTDRGASWEKRSDTVSGGTGPHYYQELYVSPHRPGHIYLVSNTSVYSTDGGATFQPIPGEHKHGDDHAIAFHPELADYMLVGSDGGVYETYDGAKNWRYIANLPVTQYYKVAVDDAAPFYNIYGGTQDNNTQGGPSRTDNASGIRNSDWYVTLFGDGHQPATEPGNPDILYSEWQQGNLVRVDRTTGEIVYIKPQPEPGDPPERFNWDAPILVSPHSPTHLYFASQRVWRSDDRGDSWTPISGDLTRDQDRMQAPIMGRQQSWDSPWDMYAMSNFHTITSLAQSPVNADILYAGTDDGLIQVTSDGGENWQKVEVKNLPGVPERAFINDIKADLFDADTVYIALDNHKEGDYRPFLLKSTDRGKRWKSIAGNLPDRHLVWRLVQDHERTDLLFAATEFGIFFTVDGGGKWIELEGGSPTISFRDLAIQRRENDLVAASFGRGFFVLDDYAPLREVSAQALESDALLLPVRDAWWYLPRTPLGRSEKGSQGADLYTAPNPPFGAVFTYYLADSLQSREELRKESEKPLNEAGEDVPFPGWDAINAERLEPDPAIWLTVRDGDGNVVRRVSGPAKKGMHRVAWDLRFPATQALGVEPGYFDDPNGPLAAPGTYSVTLASSVDGKNTELAGPVSFDVEPMRSGALQGAPPAEVAAFWRRVAELQRGTTAAGQTIDLARKRLEQLKTAVERSRSAPGSLDGRLQALREQLDAMSIDLNGNPALQPAGEPESPSINGRLQVAMIGTSFSTYGPTPTISRSTDIAEERFTALRANLNRFMSETLPAFEASLADAGAPWVPGQPIP